jgi:hypothetical protein
MKALSITLLCALAYALLFAPVHAAIPAPTRTASATAQVASAQGGVGPDMAVTLLLVAGVFLAGVAAVVLIRRGGSAA